MRFASPLPWHRRAAVRLLPIPLALIFLYRFNGFSAPADPDYWTGATASATIFLTFTAPYAALAAAIDARRVRQALPRSAVRDEYALAWDTCRWPWSAAFLLQLGGAASVLVGARGTVDILTALILLAWLAILSFHAALGYAFGRLLPTSVAVPVALIASFIPLTFSWASSFVPARYLAGLALSKCCDAAFEPPQEALWAPFVFSILMTTGIIVTLSALRARRGGILAVGVGAVCVAFLSGTLIARDLGPFPLSARNAHALVCDGENPKICLYPEQMLRPEAAATLRVASEHLMAADLPVPRMLTAEIDRTQWPDRLSIFVAGDVDETTRQRMFVNQYVDENHSEACSSQPSYERHGRLTNIALGVISHLVDTPYAELEKKEEEDVKATLALPPRERRDIILGLLTSVRACDGSFDESALP